MKSSLRPAMSLVLLFQLLSSAMAAPIFTSNPYTLPTGTYYNIDRSAFCGNGAICGFAGNLSVYAYTPEGLCFEWKARDEIHSSAEVVKAEVLARLSGLTVQKTTHTSPGCNTSGDNNVMRVVAFFRSRGGSVGHMDWDVSVPTTPPKPAACRMDAPPLIEYTTRLPPNGTVGSDHTLLIQCDKDATVRVLPTQQEVTLASGNGWSLYSEISVYNGNMIHATGGIGTNAPLSNWIRARGTTQIPAGVYYGNHVLVMSIE